MRIFYYSCEVQGRAGIASSLSPERLYARLGAWDESDYSAKQHGGPRRQSDMGRWRGIFHVHGCFEEFFIHLDRLENI